MIRHKLLIYWSDCNATGYEKTDTFKHDASLKGDWSSHSDIDPFFHLGYV